HPKIMAGQGTAALELLEETEQLDALIAPVGGGGLLSGCATIAKDLKPAVRVFGAEPEGANDTFLSMRAGERIALSKPDTIADGLRRPRPAALFSPIVNHRGAPTLPAPDTNLRATFKFLPPRLKFLFDPSGATAAAAVLFRKLPAGIGSVGVILSGGNVDF